MVELENTVDFLLLSILFICFQYFAESRIVYAYEFKKHKFPCSVAKEKIIKNKFCKFIFPIEHKSYNEALYAVSKFSIIGLIHFIIFYLPSQIATIISIIMYFFYMDFAIKILLRLMEIMFVGWTLYFAALFLSIAVVSLRNRLRARNSKRK